MEVGARDVKGLALLAKPAPRRSYAPMADKPRLPATNPQGNGTRGGGGRDGGKRMIQRLIEDRDRQKTLYLAHGADASKADRA